MVEGWKENNLGNVCLVLNGDRGINYPSSSDIKTSGIPFVNAGNLKDGEISEINMEYITEEKYASLSGGKIQKKDILFCLRGSIGKYGISNLEKGAPASSLCIIRANNQIDKNFLYYIIGSKNIKSQIISANAGSSQPNLSAKIINEFKFINPIDKKEQKAIADVLLNIDNLINLLQKTIKKKEKIVKSISWNLLSNGSTLRKYEKEELGKISQICTGNKNNEQKIANGKYPFYVRSQKIETINTYSFEGEAILIPGEGNIGKIYHYINGKFDYHQRVYKISDFPENIDTKYVYYFMKENFEKFALKNTVKATVDSLRLPTFEKFIIYYPKIKEQIRISKLLSNMDNEIEKLKQKLEKYKQIKDGMMEDLLTGKVRLNYE